MKLAIIGASKIAHKMMQVIRDVHGFNLVGIASHSPERLSDFYEKHKIFTFQTYAACFQSKEVDAVYISVLNADHYQVVKEALLSGKHVLCEKPLVLHHHEAVELFALAASQKLVLLEGLMYRFHPQIQMLKKKVSDGGLGKILSLHLSFSFFLDTLGTKRRAPAGGGGSIADLGCYCIDFAHMICGLGQVSEFLIYALKKDVSGVDETCFFSYKINGIEIFIECSIAQSSINCWEIRGEKGSVSGLRFNPQSFDYCPVWELNEESEMKWDGALRSVNPFDQFYQEFQNFYGSIVGAAQPFILPQESIANAFVIEAIRNQMSAK